MHGLPGRIDSAGGARTKHKNQWVIHGPVVYTDQLYDLVSGEKDDLRRMGGVSVREAHHTCGTVRVPVRGYEWRGCREIRVAQDFRHDARCFGTDGRRISTAVA